MTDMTKTINADGSFYAESTSVFRQPLSRQQRDGSRKTTLGFKLCEVAEGLEAQTLADILNEALRAGIIDDTARLREGVEVEPAPLSETEAPAQGWRPIETAPKHKSILVCGPNTEFAVAKWGAAVAGNDHPGNHCWVEMPGRAVFRDGEITHWMPLPPAPVQPGETEGGE